MTRDKDRRHDGRGDSAEWAPRRPGAEVTLDLPVPASIAIERQDAVPLDASLVAEPDGTGWRLRVRVRVS